VACSKLAAPGRLESSDCALVWLTGQITGSLRQLKNALTHPEPRTAVEQRYDDLKTQGV
jgi:hypothetical protein